MELFIEENSTRKNIIQLLKKNSGMSIEELSKNIKITPMGVRQHLLALEKKGIVSYVSRRQGIGRPGFIYMLTEASNDYFPSTYDNFSLGMLRDIKKHEGPEKIQKIFSWRKERLLKMNREALKDREGIDDKLTGLRKFLEDNGHLVDLSRNNGHYHLKQFHCPISKIATEFGDACKYELDMYRDLLGKNVTREHTMSEGAPVCLYIIPRA